MPKKSAQSKRYIVHTSASKDALMLGGLFLLVFVGFQIINFLSATMQDGTTINMSVLRNKFLAQFLAFLACYFITLIYIRNRVS